MSIYSIVLGVVALLSMLSTFALVLFSRRGANTLEILMSVCVMISNSGYFILSCSRNLQEAVLANALAYVGGVFLPLLIVYILIDYSDSKVPTWFSVVILLINIFVFVSTVLTDRFPYFYAGLKFDPSSPSPLIKEPGQIYYIRYIILAVEVGLAAFFTILTYLGKRSASFRLMVTYAGSLFGVMLVYLGSRFFGLKYEIIPFFYLICTLILDYVVARSTIYNVNLSVQEKINELSTFGYIVFDRKYNYVGSNSVSEKFFPEIANARIDSKIIAKDYALKDLLKWVAKCASEVEDSDKKQNKYKKSIVINDRSPSERRYLECEMSFIHFGFRNHVTGYLVEITDDTEQHNMIESMSFRGESLKREVERQTKRAKSMQMSTILGMAAMIESRDNSTGGHINRTSACVALFVEHLRKLDDYNMSENYWDSVINAAPLHDLGKIAVDDAILRKPSGLTDEEYEKMKIHAPYGAKIMSKVLEDVEDKEFVRVATNVAHYHHEKYNGTGYPDQLRGESIPFEARIMALADVFDALASRRYYKDPMSYDEAFELIRQELGHHFDPHLGRIFISLKKEIIALYESFENTDYAR
ncbi:MAG: HD domain-containing protein [Clostridiales bacterium]|nr:HD domain-containing protein [Clostridiales bacterium]MBQ5519289.1 HD domain-containing protein [Clostridiales bacterium]